jgi:hypothetical protein
MKYLLAGLGAYSIGAAYWFFIANQTLISLFIGGGLGLLLLLGSIVLFIFGEK